MKLQSLGLREWHLFWREEVLSVRSEGEALSAFGAAGGDQGRVIAGLLREAGGAGAAASPPDVARMLTSGELLLIRHAAARTATAGLGPLLWKYPQHGALSEFGAQGFLRRFTSDPLAIELIRRLTQHRLHTAFHESLATGLLFAAVARWIAAGELVVAFRMFSTGGGDTADVAAEKPAPEASPAAPPPTTAPEPETATFPSGHDASVQAQALVAASDQGVPFCEECMRAAQQ
ncbi:MAG: hypothetical protein ACRD9L_00265, partial [Bryobacteraceae bacterium]